MGDTPQTVTTTRAPAVLINHDIDNSDMPARERHQTAIPPVLIVCLFVLTSGCWCHHRYKDCSRAHIIPNQALGFVVGMDIPQKYPLLEMGFGSQSAESKPSKNYVNFDFWSPPKCPWSPNHGCCSWRFLGLGQFLRCFFTLFDIKDFTSVESAVSK